MSNLIQKLTAFVRSPQARTVIDQARRQAAKPENRGTAAGLVDTRGEWFSGR